MSIEALILGNLYRPAEAKPAANSGRLFVSAVVRVPTAGDAVFVRIAAFNEPECAALMALADGDSVVVAGPLKIGVWTGQQDGRPRPSLNMVAAQVMTAYGLAQKRKAVGAAGQSRPARQPAVPGAADHAGAGADDAWLRGAA